MAPLVGIAWQILAADFFFRTSLRAVSDDRELEKNSQKNLICGQFEENKPENDAPYMSHKCP